MTSNDLEGNFPFANGTPAGADIPRLGVRSAPSKTTYQAWRSGPVTSQSKPPTQLAPSQRSQARDESPLTACDSRLMPPEATADAPSAARLAGRDHGPRGGTRPESASRPATILTSEQNGRGRGLRSYGEATWVRQRDRLIEHIQGRQRDYQGLRRQARTIASLGRGRSRRSYPARYTNRAPHAPHCAVPTGACRAPFLLPRWGNVSATVSSRSSSDGGADSAPPSTQPIGSGAWRRRNSVGAHAVIVVERRAGIVRVPPIHRPARLGDRQVRVGQQPGHRLGPHLSQERHRAHASRSAKGARELGTRQMDFLSERIERPPLGRRSRSTPTATTAWPRTTPRRAHAPS